VPPQAKETDVSVTSQKRPGTTEVRPFHVDLPDEAMDDLRRRIAATRLPEKETVGDASQGVQLETIRELARYSGTAYDFGRVEARLNALPQFVTEIDGLNIHFIHVKSRHENALPLIITHGWPARLSRCWASSTCSATRRHTAGAERTPSIW
jgi:Epoxide hydrolase N terminus